jgi:hypothetical protein
MLCRLEFLADAFAAVIIYGFTSLLATNVLSSIVLSSAG